MTKIIKTDSYTQDKALGLNEVLLDPTVSTDTGYVYTKDDTTTELYYRSDAGIVKITSGGALNVPVVDVTKLINTPYEVELSNVDGSLTFTDTTGPTTLGRIEMNPVNSIYIGSGAGTAVQAMDNIGIGLNVFASVNSTDAETNVVIGNLAGDALTEGALNCFYGHAAGSSVTSGDKNVLIGGAAGGGVVTGLSNTIVGDQAGYALTTDSSSNVVIGSGAERGIAAVDKVVIIGADAGAVNTADGTVAIGYEAGKSNTTSDKNTFVGYQSGYGMTTGSYYDEVNGGGTFVGYQAGYSCNTSTLTAIGYKAGRGVTTGKWNALLGYKSGLILSTGADNVFLGYKAGEYANGDSNIAIGSDALDGNMGGGTGSRHVALGVYALRYSSSNGSNDNIGIGHLAGQNVTGSGNVFVGSGAADAINGPSNYNTIVGFEALGNTGSVTSIGVTAIGYQAALVNQAQGTTAVGYQAGAANSSGTGSTFVGYQAGINATGDYNTCIGYQAGDTIVGGVHNVIIGIEANSAANTSRVVAIGFECLKNNTQNGVTAIGHLAGRSNTSGDNTFVGPSAGYKTDTGTHNTYIGISAAYDSTVGDNNVAIGSLAAIGGLTGLSHDNVVIGADSMTTNPFAARSKIVCIGRSAGYASLADGSVAIGYRAGYANAGSTGCVYIGQDAGYNASGINNTLIGDLCGDNAGFTGTDNVAIGKNTLSAASGAASYNVVVGSTAGDAITDGDNNVLVGYGAGGGINTGSGTVAVGYNAGSALTSAVGGSYLGYGAGANTSGANNTILGHSAGGAIQAGAGNVIVGKDAGAQMNGASDNNVIIGYGAEDASTAVVVSSVIAIGYQAAKSNQTAGILAVGHQAGYTNTTGGMSTFVGYRAGYTSNVNHNTFVGYDCGYSTTGNENTFMGTNAGKYVSSGSGSVFIGHQAGLSSAGTPVTGSDNTCIGQDAGLKFSGAVAYNTIIGSLAGDAVTNGESNIFLGYDAGGSVTTGDYNIIIGPIVGSADDQRTFKVGYHATNTPILSGVMYDGAAGSGGTDSSLQVGVQQFTVYDPETYSGHESFRVKSGKLSTFGETAPDVIEGGLCLWHPDTDGNSVTMKSEVMSHGCSSWGEADTLFRLYSPAYAIGSPNLCGISDDPSATDSSNSPGIVIAGTGTIASAVDEQGLVWAEARACTEVHSYKISGTGVTSWGSSDFIFGIRNNGYTKFLVSGAGNVYANAYTDVLDEEDDIKLVQSFSNKNSNPYHDRLKDIGVISEGGMCDMQKMDMLSIGAIGQLFNIIRALAVKLGVSEDELYALAKQY